MSRQKLASFCCECGPNVAVDEDGLCAACGATAVGSALGRIRIHHPAAERVVRAALTTERLRRIYWNQLSTLLDEKAYDRARASESRAVAAYENGLKR